MIRGQGVPAQNEGLSAAKVREGEVVAGRGGEVVAGREGALVGRPKAFLRNLRAPPGQPPAPGLGRVDPGPASDRRFRHSRAGRQTCPNTCCVSSRAAERSHR